MPIFNEYFYHETLKRYTIAMGSMFSNISVVRKGEDGEEDHRVVVPVTYSSKENFVLSLQDDGRQEAIKLPRMAFEMTMLVYDGARKLQKNRYYSIDTNTSDTKKGQLYTPSPWDLTFELNIITKTQDEMLQIVEQIIPAFNPEVILTVRVTKDPEVTIDVPVSLMDIARGDTYEGEMTNRRQIIWTLTFIMRGQLFGPYRTKDAINPDKIEIDVGLIESIESGIYVFDGPNG